MTARTPAPPAVFVGRERELERLGRGLAQVAVAVISGVGGAGKTALALSFASRWPGRVVFHRVATDGENAAQILDALRRLLCAGVAPALNDDRDRAADLARSLDEHGALCVIDDLHRLTGDARPWIEAVATQLRGGRLLITTRHRIPIDPRDPDRIDLPLEGLEVEGARILWSVLDELQGPGPDFAQTWSRTAGLPLLLRRAHQSGAEGDDPIAETVRGLEPAALRLGAILSLSDQPLPRSLVLGLANAPPEALTLLVTRMVAVVDREGLVQVHDLFRAPLAQSLEGEARRSAHARIAQTLPALDLGDEVRREVEIQRHLRASGDMEAAASALTDRADLFIRRGATAELLAAIEALPVAARDERVVLLRARTQTRLLDVYGAQETMRPWLERGEVPGPEVRVVFGQIAMLRGELEVAELILSALVKDASVPRAIRIRAETHFVATLTHLGKGEEARRYLDGEGAADTDPLRRGFLTLSRAFSLWLEERPES